MIEIKINGIQVECKFDCTDGRILSDDIHRALIALYRVVCKATNERLRCPAPESLACRTVTAKPFTHKTVTSAA